MPRTRMQFTIVLCSLYAYIPSGYVNDVLGMQSPFWEWRVRICKSVGVRRRKEEGTFHTKGMIGILAKLTNLYDILNIVQNL